MVGISARTGHLVTAAIAAVAAGVAYISVKKVAKARAPRPGEGHSVLAEVADWNLYRALSDLAANVSVPSKLRSKANRGARILKTYWLDRGYAGRTVDPKTRDTFYGKWCGANYAMGVCVDAIDAICRNHDLARKAAFA